jgi:hypothetical protein
MRRGVRRIAVACQARPSPPDGVWGSGARACHAHASARNIDEAFERRASTIYERLHQRNLLYVYISTVRVIAVCPFPLNQDRSMPVSQ